MRARFYIAFLFVLAACAGDNFNGEELAIQPTTISGASIASLETLRMRCDAPVTTGSPHQQSCRLFVAQPDSSLVLATSLGLGVTVAWNTPTATSNNIQSLQCTEEDNGLTFSCSIITTDSVAPALHFNLTINDGNQSRMENFHSGLQNPVNPYDVSNDGFISAFDLLLIVNWINGPQTYPASSGAPYLDANGDGLINADDHEAVKNCLNNPLCS